MTYAGPRIAHLLDAIVYFLSDAIERAANVNYDTHGLEDILSQVEFEARVMRATMQQRAAAANETNEQLPRE